MLRRNDQPAGDFSSSLQLLETGLLGKHGIRKVALSWYPEGHPRIPAADLVAARAAKLAVAARAVPASRTSLLKYAMICGVGASIRALKERPAAHSMIAGETPEDLLIQVAQAQATDPSLGLQGVHFFTFASLSATVNFADEHTRTGVPA